MKIKNCKIKNFKGGYTIIETMIAVSLFVVIIMAGMGALLSANLLHQKSRDVRSIMDNLSFIMEDMSRNLRTGSGYYCITGLDNLSELDIPKSGQDCRGIAFKPAAGTEKWIYEIVSELRGSVTVYYVRKSTDSGATWTQLTPDEVVIDENVAGVQISGFSILGAESPGTGNQQQPFVTIHLSGKIIYKDITTPFSLQTSVSQRFIDI